MSEADSPWRRCSACKKPIARGSPYWVCSVSTCNRSRTALFFCSVSCWEVHLPVARHREAWAEERRAPGLDQMSKQPVRRTSGATRRLVRPQETRSEVVGPGGQAIPQEVLLIASRLKDYIRARAGMNTSDRVLEPISKIVREICDDAIRNAQGEGRKTVLDRDVPPR